MGVQERQTVNGFLELVNLIIIINSSPALEFWYFHLFFLFLVTCGRLLITSQLLARVELYYHTYRRPIIHRLDTWHLYVGYFNGLQLR